MIRFLLFIVVVLVLGFPTSSIAAAPNSIHIEENEKGITVWVNEASLDDVLESITEKAGIQFRSSPWIMNDPITVNLNAPNWPTAVRQLLESYSRVELLNSQQELTQVHILSKSDDTASLKPENPRTASVSTTASSPQLNRRQLRKIGKRPFRAPLPPNLFDDPEIRNFLNQYNIHTLEDMKDVKKTRRVRVRARDLLLKMTRAK